MHTPSREARSVRSLLLQEHLQLDVLFDCLVEAVDANATAEVRKLGQAFDVRLRAHLELEERYVIPAFAKDHRDEAERLLAEHSLIRKSLLKLGVALELHLARSDMVARFIELLHVHMVREDVLLYAWSEENLDADASSKVLERFFGRRASVPPCQTPP
jgi:hypothetical protein